jgi:putative transposase
MNDPFPDQVDEQNWDEACRRADAIRDFLKQQPDGSTIGSIAALAAELGLSQATTYRLLKLFRQGGTVSSLADRKRGRPEGHRTLDTRRDEIIRVAIHGFYLKRNRPPFSRLVREVQTHCVSAGLSPNGDHSGAGRVQCIATAGDRSGRSYQG